jgi:hypothetical protein
MTCVAGADVGAVDASGLDADDDDDNDVARRRSR